MSNMPLVTLDLCGLNCPAPLLGAKRVVDDLLPGQTMRLISDCPGTPDDLHAWARYTGNQVIATEKLEGHKVAYTIQRADIADRPTANVVLDIRGVSCPGPILEAKKMLNGMKAGEVLLLISNCPGTPADIDSWVKNTSAQELVSRQETGRGNFEFYLRKK